MSQTAESTHLSTTLQTHAPCMQGTRTLSQLPTHIRFKRLFTSFQSPPFHYKATCVTCLHNKQAKGTTASRFVCRSPTQTQTNHSITGRKKLSIYQKAVSDPFHLGVVSVCEEEEEESSVETKKMEVK